MLNWAIIKDCEINALYNVIFLITRFFYKIQLNFENFNIPPPSLILEKAQRLDRRNKMPIRTATENFRFFSRSFFLHSIQYWKEMC